MRMKLKMRDKHGDDDYDNNDDEDADDDGDTEQDYASSIHECNWERFEAARGAAEESSVCIYVYTYMYMQLYLCLAICSYNKVIIQLYDNYVQL